MNQDSILLKEIRKIDVLPIEAQHSLLELAQKGDRKAKDKLILTNMRLVLAQALKYKGVENIEDLCSCGVFGLNTAISKFKLDSLASFPTFATWEIKNEISQYIRDHQSEIRLPVSQHAKIAKAKKDAMSSGKELPDEIKELLAINGRGVSFDQPGPNGDSSDNDCLEYELPAKENVFDDVFDSERLKHIEYLLSRLNARQQDIINRLYGLDASEPETLQEVGISLGISTERVRQLRDAAIKLMHCTKIPLLDLI